MTEEQLQTLHNVMAALLNDIMEMQHSEMTELFGPFSVWSQHSDGDVSIQWPNLAISFENIQKILEEINNADKDE